MSDPQETRGAHTRAEVFSQPRCWRQCLSILDEGKEFERIRQQADVSAEWLFVGCGSSYHIALAAAASWTSLTGGRSKAVPASELLLYPDLVFPAGTACQPVLISRSGLTSEVLKAAAYLESKRNIRTLALSCTQGQPLQAVASSSLTLFPADEQSTVMTRSFTSMLLALQSLAAAVASNSVFAAALHALPASAQSALDSMAPRIDIFVRSHAFADHVFLAHGPFFGLAAEGQLKVKEMSISCAQAYHTLEFRHGPKSIVTPETLVTFLLSESACEAEQEVLEEMRELGATTLVIAGRADARTRASADLLLELKLGVPELAGLAAFAFAGQLLGLYTGLRKGIDPDNPRNLTRAVILDTMQ